MSRVPLPPWWYRAAAGALEPWTARWGQGGDGHAIAQRHGRGLPAAGAWIHAASAGEATGVAPLVAEWRRRRPAERLLVTALTPSGRRALARELPDLPVGAPPVDSPGAARRALAACPARRLVLLETELWPCWLAAALESGARIAVVNGRLSDRNWRRYRRWAWLFRPYTSRLGAVAAQTAIDADRWAELGVPAERIRVTGNTKFDRLEGVSTLPAGVEKQRARERLGLAAGQTWCVFASLRPGEERWVQDVLQRLGAAAPHFLIVPRHPDRWRSSRARLGEGERVTWLLSLGVLADAYRAADFVVLGGTLEPYGGHNPVEAAALGLPVLLGPSVENCRAAAAGLLAAGGARLVESPEALASAVADWTSNAEARRMAGDAAARGARSLGGASACTLDWLEACGMWSQ